MIIDVSFIPNKRTLYTHAPLLASIYVASGNYVSNLTTPSESSQGSLLTSDAPDTYHIITRDKPGNETEKIGYHNRKHDGTICYKKYRLY